MSTHLFVQYDSYVFVKRFIHTCDVTHSYVWRVMAHSYMWHDSFICVTWLILMCDMTHSYIWDDALICATWLLRVDPYQMYANTLQHSATHLNTLQLTATRHNTLQRVWRDSIKYAQTQIHLSTSSATRIHLSASLPPICVYHPTCCTTHWYVQPDLFIHTCKYTYIYTCIFLPCLQKTR